MSIKESDIILTKSSKRFVTRICDDCGNESRVAHCDIQRSREKLSSKYGINRDLCRSCSRSVCQKIRPNNIKHNLRVRRNKSSTYLIRSEHGEDTFIHKANYEKFYSTKVGTSDVVHHINLDSLDNSKENLLLISGDNREDSLARHASIHKQLDDIAGELIKRGIIYFSRKDCKYHIDSSVPLRTAYEFDSVRMEQQKNVCRSRNDADISSEIVRGIVRPVPLIAANMSTVVNAKFCILLYKLGALGIMHRAWSNNDEYINEVKMVSGACDITAASIGVGNSQIELAKRLIREGGANVICIDIAHGFSDEVATTGKALKRFSKDTKVIVGNTTNKAIIPDVHQFADAIKVGLATGLACETKNTAGVYMPQFSAVLNFKQAARDAGIPIISDGGIRESSHVVKALAAGANSVMMGSIFCACPESAGEIINHDGIDKKLYAGMASRYVQDRWRGGLKSGTCSEGKVVYLDVKRPVVDLIERYSGAIRSGITYNGATNIREMQDKVKFIYG